MPTIAERVSASKADHVLMQIHHRTHDTADSKHLRATSLRDMDFRSFESSRPRPSSPLSTVLASAAVHLARAARSNIRITPNLHDHIDRVPTLPAAVYFVNQRSP